MVFLASKLSQFLESFDDEEKLIHEEDKNVNPVVSDENKLCDHTQDVRNVKEKPKQELKLPVQQVKEPVQEQQFIRQVERIKRKPVEQVQVQSQQNVQLQQSQQQQQATPKLKLKLKLNSITQQKQVEVKQIKQEQVRTQQVQTQQIRKPVQQVQTKVQPQLKQQLIEDDTDLLEELFRKSGTPLEQKEPWMITIKKARKAKVNTMFNKKVSDGRFRFTATGELEILPELDVSGKSSKEIINMDWHLTKKIE